MKQGLRTSECKRQSPQFNPLRTNHSNDAIVYEKDLSILNPFEYNNINAFEKQRASNQSPVNKGETALAKRLKNMENEAQNNQEAKNRNSKSIIKLPNINAKTILNKQSSEKEGGSAMENSPGTQNSLKGLIGKAVNTDKKIFSQEVEQKVDQLSSNFMQIINVKPLKPLGRSPQKNLDRSLRDVRLNKLEQTIKTDLRKAKEAESIKKGIKRQKSQQRHIRDQTKVASRDQNRGQRKIRQQNNHMSNSTENEKVMIRSRKTFSINSKSNSNGSTHVSAPSTQTSILPGSNTVALIDKKKKIRTTFIDFCMFISMTNKMNKQKDPVTVYKAYVGKGNNSVMIKNIIKTRFWWNIVPEADIQCNLTWTEGRDNKLIQSMKKLVQQQKNSQNKGKVSFHIKAPNKEDLKVTPVKQYTRYGLSKLVSEQQNQKYSKGDYTVQLPAGQYRNVENPNKTRIHNHVEFNWNMTNKKALFYNMRAYYTALKENPFQYIPLTFHIHNSEGLQWDTFQKAYYQREQQLKERKSENKKKVKNLWIIKPGENSNQGFGIEVSDSLQQIKQMIRANEMRENGGKNRSFIVQRYLMPFLYSKRKFDIRCYMLVTSVNSILKCYWYEEGYIRTSCKEFNIKDLKNKFIHLTNDAIQKKCEEYGKFENGNKVSFPQFQKYLDNVYGQKHYNFYDNVYPKMMKLAGDSVKSTTLKLDSNRREFCFEVYGLDFMIDEQFNTWLIQVNNNPCLALPTPLQARIIPAMIENAFRIAVDPFFPPPTQYPKSKPIPSELFQSNKFTLIYNSSDQEGQDLQRLLRTIDVLQQVCEEDQEQQQNEDQAQQRQQKQERQSNQQRQQPC